MSRPPFVCRGHQSATLTQILGKALKHLRYTVDQKSSTHFVCKPKHFIARLFEFNKLHVCLLDDSVDLIGPAIVVDKLCKQLGVKTEPRP